MASILVVDDDVSVRSTMALLFRTRGHHVWEADGVVSALRELSRAAPDFVVTDLRMADGGGLEVVRAARVRRPDAGVIVLTAYAGWESAKEAMRLGALDYFEKGNDPAQLFRRIDAALAERGRRALDLASLDGDHRRLTVLFADLRESMELLTALELEPARRILDDVLELMIDSVHRYSGTVNQVMGDGIMALFGAPLACQDHAACACRAAVRMQRAVAAYAGARGEARDIALEIRVGINSGDVLVRAIGSDVRRELTAVGQPVHVAARLERLARPGRILVSGDTLRLAGGGIAARPVGRLPIKGLSQGVEAWELLGHASQPDTELG
jgi:class 3 adenylate cyclase